MEQFSLFKMYVYYEPEVNGIFFIQIVLIMHLTDYYKLFSESRNHDNVYLIVKNKQGK